MRAHSLAGVFEMPHAKNRGVLMREDWDMFSDTLLHKLNGKHVVFAKLSANVQTTWQCPVEDLCDLLLRLKDRNPTYTICIKHTPYEGLSTHAPLGTINCYTWAQSECGKAIPVQYSLFHSNIHWLEQGKQDQYIWCFWCASPSAMCVTNIVRG